MSIDSITKGNGINGKHYSEQERRQDYLLQIQSVRRAGLIWQADLAVHNLESTGWYDSIQSRKGGTESGGGMGAASKGRISKGFTEPGTD